MVSGTFTCFDILLVRKHVADSAQRSDKASITVKPLASSRLTVTDVLHVDSFPVAFHMYQNLEPIDLNFCVMQGHEESSREIRRFR